MKQHMRAQWTYGLGLISVASLVIGVLPSYSGQQSGGHMSGGQSDQQAQGQQQQGQQAQEQQSQTRSRDGERWQRVSGTITKMRTFDVGNGDEQNLVVQVQTDQGRQRTIDLGNVEDLEDFDLQRGDRITAWGKTKSISGRQLLMAKKLKIDGQKITIDRPEFSSSRRQAARHDQDMARQDTDHEGQPLKKIRGEVVGTGEVVTYERRGHVTQSDRDAFYIVEEPDGRQAHLLVGEQLDPWLNVGDSIEARVAPDGRVVAISQETDESFGRPEMQQSRRGGQNQGNRQDQFSREQQSGQQRSQDQLSRQQQSGQQRDQTARQSEDERQ